MLISTIPIARGFSRAFRIDAVRRPFRARRIKHAQLGVARKSNAIGNNAVSKIIHFDVSAEHHVIVRERLESQYPHAAPARGIKAENADIRANIPEYIAQARSDRSI